MATKSRTTMRVIRHERLRKGLKGTADRPRLAVFRSLRHISAQIIDDTRGHTLAAASSQESALAAGDNVDGAKKVGAALADRARKAGVETVVFDRGGYRYHGAVAALADAVREGGVKF
jgi:large subunit ribosomal protein L18